MAKDDRLSWLDLGAPDYSGEARAIVDATQERLGFTRNLHSITGHNSPLLVAIEGVSQALMRDPEEGVSDKERELIALVVSVENQCPACIFGHASQLRRITGDAVWVARVEANYRHADLTAREKAMADYAFKLTVAPAEVEESDIVPLRQHGFSERDILRIAAITAYFNMSNRLNSGLGVRPNDPAYAANR
jgi:uncharacterized peroxidase-related enzyme